MGFETKRKNNANFISNIKSAFVIYYGSITVFF